MTAPTPSPETESILPVAVSVMAQWARRQGDNAEVDLAYMRQRGGFSEGAIAHVTERLHAARAVQRLLETIEDNEEACRGFFAGLRRRPRWGEEIAKERPR